MSADQNMPGVKLKRVLSLTDLIIYGIILIQPIAALPLFGHANHISKGHAVTSILVAMVAMIFTAISYGRMAHRYPVAGSAYTYVGKGIHPFVGFIAGWSMFMDYMFIPILCVIFTSIAANHMLPYVAYPFWIFFFSAGFTLLNLNGIRLASRANWTMMIIMTAVVFYFMAAAVRYIVAQSGFGGLVSIKPFYNPITFSLPAIGSATSLAALTYIGFDGITTLSEEVRNPKRNVLLAAVITCLITGLWSGAQVYLAQLSWPDWESFVRGVADTSAQTNALDTAIMAVARRVGGSMLDSSLSFILLLGSIGSGVTGQIGASRLLYGMGRDNVIPRKVFGHLSGKSSVPSYNLMIVGILSLAGALLLNYEECAHLINFGAFFAFMGVNLATIREFYFRKKGKSLKHNILNLIIPSLGFIFSMVIWLNLPLKTFVIGGSWMVLGIIYLGIKTKGYRTSTPMIDFMS